MTDRLLTDYRLITDRLIVATPCFLDIYSCDISILEFLAELSYDFKV
jgi:hypothetical protein